MTKGLTVLIVLSASGVCHGGLLTNFAASYALYQQCTMSSADFDADGDVDGTDFLNWQRGLAQTGQFINANGDADLNGMVNQPDLNYWMGQYAAPPGASESVCFKLYLDPEGITQGSVTLFIDVPNPQPGTARLAFSPSLPNLIDVHPDYTVQVDQAVIIPLPGRERLEGRAVFTAKNPINPPAGPVTLFGYQIMDSQPQLGPGGSQLGFDFRPGDSVTVFDPTTGTTTFDDASLADVSLQIMRPLVLDVNVQTGSVSIRNPSIQPININYYEIKSVSGAMRPQTWFSIDDSESDPPGIGWEEAGGASPNAISESNLMGSLVVEPGQPRGLGLAFDQMKRIQDLTFFYTTLQGSLIPGEINYNNTSMADPVPEPSCLAWALAAGVGWASRRRALLRNVA